MKAIDVFEIIWRSYYETTHTTSGNVQWLVEHRSDCTVIAFRGTELSGSRLFPDLMHNGLSILPLYDKQVGWASMGYLLAAKRAVDDLYHYLETKGHLEKPIVLAGHSMGGAISFLCAVKMHKDGAPVKAWVGTGVVNCVISRDAQPFKCFNYRYKEDPISLYPPRWLGFKQPSPKIQIGVDATHGLFDFGDLSDHRMMAYLNNSPDTLIV